MIYFLFEASMTLKLASGVRIQGNKKLDFLINKMLCT